MKILSEIGLDMASAEVRDILGKAGCIAKDERVFFPAQLVRQCIELAPQKFAMYGLDPEAEVEIGDGLTHIQPMIGRLNILDHGGLRRRTNLDDLANIVAVCDAMSSYDVLHGAAVMPGDDAANRRFRGP